MARPASNDAGVPALPPGTRPAAVVSTYHREVTGAMLGSATETLRAAGAEEVRVVEVPGAFELPVVAQRLARREDVDVVLCFGLVLRGETDHDRYIASAVADALQQVALATDKPVLFGLLTCNDLGQARRRARLREEDGLDKGREVALAAVRVLHALREASASTPTAGRRTRAPQDVTR